MQIKLRFYGYLVPTMVVLIIFMCSMSAAATEDGATSKEQPLPANGAVQIFTEAEQFAPLQVKTLEGQYYFLKIVDSKNGADILTVFIHGSQTVNLKLPLGIYQIKYAYGEKWYGYDKLFGPDTNYSKVEDLFEFKVENNYVYGYNLILYQVENGNLETKPIKPEEF